MKHRDSRFRRYSARFYRHNGNRDAAHGQPTYEVATDWEPLPGSFPCEVLDTAGSETIRGRQVTEKTTHVLFGEYYSADRAQPADRVRLSDGRWFSIVSVLDQDGHRSQRRIEVRLEQ